MAVRDLIYQAGKKWRIFASGETPSADELADGLTAFQQIVDEVFVGWTDVDKSAAYEAKEDERIKTTSTVTMPTLVDDPAGRRRPRSGAKVMVIDDSATTLSVYRGDLAAWQTASGLTLDSEPPFDAQLHNMVADALAGRYCDLFGEPTASQFRAGQRAIGLLSLATRPTVREAF